MNLREIIFAVLGSVIGTLIVWRYGEDLQPPRKPVLDSEQLFGWAGIGLCVLVLISLGGC